MRSSYLPLLLALLISSAIWSADKPTPLALDERTTLRVGELAVLDIPQDRPYHRASGAGDALSLIRHSKRTNLYRAVRPGEQVIIIGPADIPKGGCISCVARHYFVTVVANK